MNKKFAVFLSALFCCFIGGMALVSLLLPKKAFSPMENRYLQKTPQFSLERVTSGAFMSDAESYVSDHIAGRDLWVAMKAWSERLSGKQENNGVYFGKNDTLINRVDQPDMDQLEQNLSYVDALTADLSVPVYFGLIPSSAAIWADRLPHGAPTADEKGIIHQLSYETGAQSIDLYAALDAHKSEDIYYRTDHHWTTKGAYLAYEAYMKAAGREDEILTQEELEAVKQETPDFCGTLYSQAGARFYEPDTITWYDFPGLTMEQPGKEPTSIYDRSYLDQKDKYSLFFGGNPPALTIRNENPEAHGTLLVVKDSFANSLLPYLAESYEEIYVFDPRYNRTPISEYAAQCGADEILVLYQTGNFAEDVNVGLLSR